MKKLNHASYIQAAVVASLVAAFSMLASTASRSLAQDSNAQGGQQASNQNQDQTQTAVQARAQQDLAKQRQDAEQEARKNVDQDALAAIKETENALNAINDGKTDQALAAIERATGKINVLTARNPATALLPVAAEVQVIDTAPIDPKGIKQLGKAAERAVDDKDYPTARVILQGLISEIRVRTYHLPLATYPIAMRDAARLLDQKKMDEAKAALQLALNTLAVVDRVSPLPLATAQTAIEEARSRSSQDKEAAQRLLEVAKLELERARQLGYAGKDPEYTALNDSISDVDKQLRGGGDSSSAFARLKEKFSSFFRRQSQSEKKAEVASTR